MLPLILEVRFEQGTEWLLVLDLELGRAYIQTMGGTELGVHPVESILNSQYGGIAVLGTA